jgi:3-dehydroquinate synthetase
MFVRDATETGVRALLNLGHTFGHALEAATGYSERLLHGEAVAIGMAQAFRFSERLGLADKGQAARVESHLRSVNLPTRLSDIKGTLPPPAKLLEIMRQDKKAIAGKLTFILVRAIGQAFIARDVEEKDVLAFLMEEQAGT